MSFDKFANWVGEQNIFIIGAMILAAVIIAGMILKTAWGIWGKRD